jgi:hypothetical protein
MLFSEIHSTLFRSEKDTVMARRILNRRELRAELEAAEAQGISRPAETRRSPQSRPESARRPKPVAGPRTRVVWAVCDLGGRPVARFDYPCKAEAEALINDLKAKGKGTHFLRSLKEPISADRE